MRGFPIRTSWPQRSVISSTRLIADSHVLHRLLLPRHPPCALKHLHTHVSHQNTRQKSCTDKNKMLASTMQFPNNNPHPHHHNPTKATATWNKDNTPKNPPNNEDPQGLQDHSLTKPQSQEPNSAPPPNPRNTRTRKKHSLTFHP